jgi:hypothetical protein
MWMVVIFAHSYNRRISSWFPYVKTLRQDPRMLCLFEQRRQPVRYYTLSIDLEETKFDASSPGGFGGWEQAWHRVRGHLRHLKSGQAVAVRSHAKGNSLKGIITKDETRSCGPEH